MSDLRRRLALLLPRDATGVGGLLAAIANAALRVAIVPVFVMPVFDTVLAAGDASRLPAIVGVAAIVGLANAGAQYLQDALLGTAAARLAARWRARLYARLLARTPGTLPGTSGGLSGRVLFDLREVEVFWQYGLGTLVAESATVLGILAYLAVLDPAATTLLIALGLPTVVGLRLLGRALQRVARRSQEGSEALGRALQEGFRHHEGIRAFGATRMMLARLRPLNELTERAMRRRAVLAAAQAPATMLLTFAAVAGLVLVLTNRAMAGAMSTGEVIGYLTLVALLSTPAQLLPRGLALASQAASAADRLLELAGPDDGRAEPTPEAPDPGGAAPDGVALRDVRHGFGGETVLRGVDVDFPARGLVAIRGESGAGKTTLLRLLLGFLDPDGGRVTLDGARVAALDDATLRRRVSYVPQGLDLLSGTLRDNLAMGRDLSDEELWRALREVGLEEHVRTLPDGLGHVLAEDGGGFSGGQRQRVALARAVASEPEVILLDEPTSSLDEGSEAEVVSALRREAQRRLLIVVAHRPGVVRAADAVWRLEAGRLRAEAPAGDA